jgi:hypothetical protein
VATNLASVDSCGNAIPLLQAAQDPNDHTDKNYRSDQSVTKHCSLREQHPRIWNY